MAGLCLLLLVAFASTSARQSTEHDPCHCQTVDFGDGVNAYRFKNPGPPEDCCPGKECDFQIEPGNGSHIFLAFDKIESKRPGDYLEVYETYEVNQTEYRVLVLRLFNMSSYHAEVRFASADNSGFFLRSKTDESTDHRKFSWVANFTRSTILPSSSPVCPKIFHRATDDEMLLESPRGQHTPATCFYLINATAGQFIELSVKHIEPGVVLRIYDTENYPHDEDPLMSLDEKNVNAHGNIVSRTSSLFIIMGNGSHGAGTKDLFVASFKQTSKSPCSCFEPKLLLAPGASKNITSPGYPQYCDSMKCPTKIVVDRTGVSSEQKFALRIRINDLHLDENDYVRIFGGNENDVKELISFSETNNCIAPYARNCEKLNYFTVSGDYTEILFESDDDEVSRGFNFNVTVVSTREGCQCPDGLPVKTASKSEENITFQIAETCDFLDCFFSIEKPEKEHAHMSSLKFKTRFLSDNLDTKNGTEEFIDVQEMNTGDPCATCMKEYGRNLYTAVQLHRCITAPAVQYQRRMWYHLARPQKTSGRRKKRASFRSPPRYVPLDAFCRDADGGASDQSDKTGLLSIVYKWTEGCSCGGDRNFTAESNSWKSFTSPLFPQNYCDNVYCEYRIKAEPGYIILLNVSELALEPNNDYLVIYNGPTTNGSRVLRGTGIEINRQEQSKTNEVFGIFYSDYSLNMRGFRVFYKAEPIESDEINYGNRGTLKGSGKLKIVIIITSCIVMVLIAASFVSFKRRLLCFSGNRFHDSSLVGFSNFAAGDDSYVF